MEEVNSRNSIFDAALNSLQQAINDFEKQNKQHSLYEYRKSRDSLIQRFEYCADLFWKTLNDHLRKQLTIFVEAARPKPVLKESNSVGLINNNELALCERLIEDRNRTSHTYHEQLAEIISQRIPAYYQLMNNIIQRLEK